MSDVLQSTAQAVTVLSPATRHLPELEALRGLAITLVVLFHFDGFVYLAAGRPDTVPVAPVALVRCGYTGVALFFVLSAFLLSLPFLAEPPRGPYVSLRRFAERRALRILPLYYCAVVVATVLTAQRFGDLWRAVPYFFFLEGLSGFGQYMAPYSGVWWSLATEMQFYLLLPLLPLCRRSRYPWLGAALLLAYGAVYAAFQLNWLRATTIEGAIKLEASIVGRGPQFLAGIAAAWLYLRLRQRAARPQPWWWRQGGADLLLIGVLLAQSSLLRAVLMAHVGPPSPVPYHLWHAAEGSLWAAVVLLVLLAPLRLKTWLVNRPFQYLGTLSYSIYLWHVGIGLAVFGIARKWTPLATWSPLTDVTVLIVLALCVVVSALTYRFIELPFLTRKARVAR